jgi:iron(3+)-hydroxamate import system permease protein FhuB
VAETSGPAQVGSSSARATNNPARATETSNADRVRKRGPFGVCLVAVLIGLLVALTVASIAVGSRLIPVGEVWNALFSFDSGDDAHLVIRELRLPRTFVAIMGGACLGLAGALAQSLTRNPLAEPGTLGISQGAASGVMVGLFFTSSSHVTVYVWFAFVGATLTGILVHRLGRAETAGTNPTRLILAGAALSIVLWALNTILLLAQPPAVQQIYRNWAVGSLAGRSWENLPVLAGCLVLGAVISCILAPSLNAATLGADMSKALGVKPRTTWALTNLAIIVLAGGATAAAGPVVFVGMACPHLARTLAGTDHRRLLPLAALLGGVTTLAADVLGRVIIYPGEVGVGAMTSILGAPIFVWLVRRGKVLGL